MSIIDQPVKRHHHYVWREYLKPWMSNGKVFCLRDNRIFSSNPMGVGQERDFYVLANLTDKDIAFIRGMSISPGASTEQKEYFEEIIDTYRLAAIGVKFSENVANKSPEALEVGKRVRSNLIEEHHSAIENIGFDPLQMLRAGDASFLDGDEGFLDFTTYLYTQFLRTKKSYSLSLSSTNYEDMIEKTWPIIAQLWAVSMANTAFQMKDSYSLNFYRADDSIDFITCDQPVINTLPKDRKPNSFEFEVYYPISPRLSVIFGNLKHKQSVQLLGNDEVRHFNNEMVRNSHEQLYAFKKESLVPYWVENN